MMTERAKTVLLVDDNRTFVMYAGLLLKRMGYEVIPTGSAFEAIKLLKMMSPDALILDVNMPEMDGPSLLRQIKSDEEIADIPVIMASADGSEKTLQECRRLGCSGYVLKPLTPESLHRCLQDALTPEGAEKRRHFRVAFEGRVSVRNSGQTQELYAVNLSQGGIYIRKKDPLPVGTVVTIRFAAGDHIDVSLDGVVIYKKDIYDGAFKMVPGMAIQFKGLSAEKGDQLKAFINDLLTRDLLEEQDELVISIC
ncbi:response regulator [Trichloromonas sp.]|uniref:response regulator n=1 Tax=Trichloromonas sp. TaxID=3069249 RepID=UPI003D81792D